MQSNKYVAAFLVLLAAILVYIPVKKIWADPIGPLVEERCSSVDQSVAEKAGLALQPPAPVWIGCGRQKPLDIIPLPPVNEEIVAGSKKLQGFGGVMIYPENDTQIDYMSIKLSGNFKGKAKFAIFHGGKRVSEIAEAQSGGTTVLKTSLCLLGGKMEDVYISGIAKDIEPFPSIIQPFFSSIEGMSTAGSISLKSEFPMFGIEVK
jgi:hypothetical protein